MKHSISIGISFLLLVAACQKKDPVPEVPVEPIKTEQAKVAVDVSPMFGSENLQFQKYYLNAAGDSVSVTRFAYYISNVVLVKSDGNTYAETESYHLLDHTAGAAKGFTINNVPTGDYISMRFLIGVDSLRNCSGAQSGALDPAKGMFWTWNSGYIFLKLEGRAPRSAGNKAYTYHIGGFKGPNKTQQQLTMSFGGSTLKTVSAGLSRINLTADASEVFKNPTTLDVSTFYYQMGEGPGAKTLAENYKDMFTLKGIQNP